MLPHPLSFNGLFARYLTAFWALQGEGCAVLKTARLGLAAQRAVHDITQRRAHELVELQRIQSLKDRTRLVFNEPLMLGVSARRYHELADALHLLIAQVGVA